MIGGPVGALAPGNDVVLRSNGGNALSIGANVPFTFGAPVADAGAPAVTASTQPASRTMNAGAAGTWRGSCGLPSSGNLGRVDRAIPASHRPGSPALRGPAVGPALPWRRSGRS